MALSIYLIVKLYDTLFLSLRVPIMAVEVDGSMRFIGSIHPFATPVLAYDIVLSMVLTAILSSLASVLIYSSLMGNKYRSAGECQDNLVMGSDGRGDGVNAVSSIALSTLEKRALQIIRRRGGMMTQAELGRELGLSKYQVSRLVKKLEAKGVIERRRAGVTNVLILHNGFNALNKFSKNKD